MRVKERYIAGNHWIISDISGQKIRIQDARRDWRNLWMEVDQWSPKQPQLTIIPRQEKISVAVVRTQNINQPLQDPPFNPATGAI